MAEITIKDIAKQCRVGVSTVSRAMNNHPDINPQTKQAILQVIQETGFIPNNSARNLKRIKARNIAVLLKGITNPLFAGMIKVIENEIQKKRHNVMIRQVDFDEDEMDVALELIKEKRLQGIIFLGGYFCHSQDKMELIQIPYVFSTVGNALPNMADKLNFSSVAVDDLRESYELVRYLIGLGHKKIVHISAESEKNSVGQLRLSGYRKALEEAGIVFDPGLVLTVREGIEHYSMENGYETMKAFLKKKLEFTAVFATADILAAGAGKALLEAGIKVPEQVSVAGFDGIELSRYFHPSITTVCQPAAEMAEATVRLLFELIEQDGDNQHLIFPGRLEIRESTGKVSRD